MSQPPPRPLPAPLDVPLVQLAQVLGGAVPFKEGNINDTYRGLIWTGTSERTAIIKDLEPRELANEVLCAALGVRLGLPVPPPYLALAAPDRLPAAKGPEVEGGRLVFASTDVGHPQVAMWLRSESAPAVVARIAQWPNLGRLYGFDALVANVDRHMGNLLFAGNGDIWLIDHGHCFTGPKWDVAGLRSADMAVRSRLNEWLTPRLSDEGRKLSAGQAATVELDAAAVDIRAFAFVNHLAGLLELGEVEAVATFLQQRTAHVPRLAAQTLNIAWMV